MIPCLDKEDSTDALVHPLKFVALSHSGGSTPALQNGNEGTDSGNRGVSVPIGDADAAEAGVIEDAHRRRKGHNATASADGKTDSIAESDDSLPLALLVDVNKKRPTALSDGGSCRKETAEERLTATGGQGGGNAACREGRPGREARQKSCS